MQQIAVFVRIRNSLCKIVAFKEENRVPIMIFGFLIYELNESKIKKDKRR